MRPGPRRATSLVAQWRAGVEISRLAADSKHQSGATAEAAAFVRERWNRLANGSGGGGGGGDCPDLEVVRRGCDAAELEVAVPAAERAAGELSAETVGRGLDVFDRYGDNSTAAIPMDNPYCSCKLTDERSRYGVCYVRQLCPEPLLRHLRATVRPPPPELKVRLHQLIQNNWGWYVEFECRVRTQVDASFDVLELKLAQRNLTYKKSSFGFKEVQYRSDPNPFQSAPPHPAGHCAVSHTPQVEWCEGQSGR